MISVGYGFHATVTRDNRLSDLQRPADAADAAS